MDVYKLTNETIDMLSESLWEMYLANGAARKDALRAKLLLEEALLKYQTRFGEDIDVYYREYRIFTQIRFSVRLDAPSFDPFTLEENPMAFMMQSILSAFEGAMPTWRYRNLEDEIVFTVRKKRKLTSGAVLLIAVAVAVIAGLLANWLVPQIALTAFTSNYVIPLCDAYAGLFCVMAVLLTFFAITLSIVHVGDMAAIGAMGGKLMKRFYLMSVIFALLLTLPCLPLVHLSRSADVSISAKSLYDLLIGFIPTNFVSAFLNFNSVHIMIIGLMFGFSLLAMGQKGETVVKVFEEGNMVGIYTNNFLNKFICIYVGLRIFATITMQDSFDLGNTAVMIALILGAYLLIIAFYTAYTCLKKKWELGSFLKMIWQPIVVALSSANFGAAFSCTMDSLIAMKTDENTINIGFSLGSVVFQPASIVMFTISSIYMASAYRVDISVIWLVLMFVLSIVLVATMPNIPGAAISVFTLLFSQLGLPGVALSRMIALTALLQFPTVAVDLWALICEVACAEKPKIKAKKNKFYRQKTNS